MEISEKSSPYLVGIAGGSASGKTYLLNSLMNYFRDGDICLISQDDYYRPKELQFIDENGEINYDLPEGIDDAHLLRDLRDLQSGKIIEKLEYTFNNPNATPRMLSIKPAPIIVIEGLFIFHFQEICKLFDYKVFVDADHDIKLNRRMERDQKERGYSQEIILYQWHNHVIPAYEQYLLPYRQYSDFVIHNNDCIGNEIEALSGHLKKVLTESPRI